MENQTILMNMKNTTTNNIKDNADALSFLYIKIDNPNTTLQVFGWLGCNTKKERIFSYAHLQSKTY